MTILQIMRNKSQIVRQIHTVMEYQLYIFIIKVGQADNEMDNV
jgi:hypothetical protein